MTLHDDQGTVHAQEVVRFGPFDTWLDVERWTTTRYAELVHRLDRARNGRSSS